MSEFKVGDKVWIEAEVIDIVGDAVRVRADLCDESFWVNAGQCKPVESEAVEQSTKREQTEAQKIAERTLKAIWATQPDPEPTQQTETVGPKTICVGDPVIYRGMKGVVLEWFEATQLFSFQSERGYKGCVRESDLKPIEPKPEVKQPTTTATHYGPDISRVSFEFTQDPNTLGTTDASGYGSEDLTVECEYQLPGEEPFFVIRTTSGWSFDEPETLLALLNSVKDAENKCRCSLPQS